MSKEDRRGEERIIDLEEGRDKTPSTDDEGK